jgi:hypothetical protein
MDDADAEIHGKYAEELLRWRDPTSLRPSCPTPIVRVFSSEADRGTGALSRTSPPGGPTSMTDALETEFAA